MLNLFMLSNVFLSVTSIFLAVFVFFKNRRSKLNYLWALTSLGVATWSFGISRIVISESVKEAWLWNYFLYMGAIFIPIFFYHFTLVLLKKEKSKKFSLIVGYLLCLAFQILNYTKYFVKDVPPKFMFNHWVEPGEIYYFFFAFFVGYFLYSLVLLFRHSLNRSNPDRNQIKYILIGSIIGVSGGITNFFPQFFNIYPFGNYLIILYVFFVTYSILKYQLFNIKSLATELFTIAISLVLFTRIFFADNLTEKLVNVIVLVAVFVFGVLIVRSVMREVKTREEKENLAKDLERANDRLKELDQMKSEFLSLATHQIRAPLTAIRGYAANVMDGDYGEISPKVRGAIQVIATSCTNLVVIVDEFLNISRIEQGRMKYDVVDFDATALIQEILIELKPTIEKTSLTMNLELSDYICMAHGDVGKIKQVVNNIIDNSIKYTKQGGINVSLSCNGQYITIKISDTGIGIAPEDIPKLFTKFTRAKDAFRTNVIGTGLGLYIAKQMVEAQDGKIWVESDGLGKGSTFFIQLPKA